jgi:hypothetical protein
VQALDSGLLVAMLRYMTSRGLSEGLPQETVTGTTLQSYALAAGFGLSIPVFFATSYAWVLWIVVPMAIRRRSRLRHG